MIKISVSVGNSLANKIDQLINDRTMLLVHNTLARMCDPYVPMDEGVLAQTTEITAQSVHYLVPYAHYMYTGEIYGPNIPIKDELGEIVGWWSPPGQPKYPTGRPITYSTEKHPLATKEWDKVMLRDKKDEFTREIKEILKMRARQI